MCECVQVLYTYTHVSTKWFSAFLFLPHLTVLLKRYFLFTSSLFLFPEGGVIGDGSLCTEGSVRDGLLSNWVTRQMFP